MILAVMSAAVAQPNADASNAAGIETTYQEHTRGVGLARAGQHDEGLAVLLPLLARFPDDYPLQRDVILITLWKGDCRDALRRFERVRQRADLEPYLVVPVSDCLLDANRPKEARRLVRQTLARHPGNESLGTALLKIDLVLRVDENIDEDSPAVAAELVFDESERSLPEWIAYLEGSARIVEHLRLYARYRFTRAVDQDFRSGNRDRVGAGIRYRIDERLLVDQEISADLFESGQTGGTTRLLYEPRDAWRFMLMYASFAEAIPLQARAAGIDARQWGGEVVYESRDYRWDGLASVNYYDFSDNNQRTAIYARAGYAYAMRAAREQRLYLEGYHSNNTLNDAVYFNPVRDTAIGLLHQTDFIYASRFRRHVDHLWLSVGAYAQEDFPTRGRGALRYEQDYDFDDRHALVAGAGVARNVYDGKYETEWRLYLYYHQRF